MRARIKRWVKRLVKTGGLFVLVGIGVMMGLIIGANSHNSRETVVIRHEYPDQYGRMIELPADVQIEERMDIPPIPTIPPIPEIPEIPAIPDIPAIPPMPEMPRTIYIDRGPSFFEVVNGIGTVLASFGLIGLGVVMIVRGRRAPKEKTPESLNK